MWIFTFKFYKNILYNFSPFCLHSNEMKRALIPRPFFSLWVRLTFCNKNIPSILKARCSASSLVHSRVTTSARLHKRHQITGAFVLFSFLKMFFSFLCFSIYPSDMLHVRKRERDSTSGWYLQQKLTSLLLMLEYLSAFFFKQCQNISQHHHYIIEKICRKYGPAHFK